MKPATKASIMLVLAVLLLSGAEPYRKPPQAVLDVLNSPLTPTLAISPTRHFAMQGQPIRYPPIAELAQPMLRIAGMRFHPDRVLFRSQLTPHAHLGYQPYAAFRHAGPTHPLSADCRTRPAHAAHRRHAHQSQNQRTAQHHLQQLPQPAQDSRRHRDQSRPSP